MSRRQAREFALQALYQLDLIPAETQDADVQEQQALDTAFMESEEAVSEKTRDFAKALVHGVRTHGAAIDERIGQYAKWKISRMAVVDRSIARIAVYEMTFAAPRLTPNIAIDEAVELAKIFGTDDSAKFLNGVLDAIAKAQKAETAEQKPQKQKTEQ